MILNFIIFTKAFDRIQKYNGGSYEKVIGAATATVLDWEHLL